MKVVGALIDETIDMVLEHGHQEERFIHRPLATRIPAIVACIEAEHRTLDIECEQLRVALDRARACALGLRSEMWANVDRAFARWMGGQLRHMAEEDDTMLPATLAHVTDEELLAIRRDIQLHTDPLYYGEWMRWYMRGMSNSELASLLGAARGAPPRIFASLVDVARSELGPRWTDVQTRAGL
jgi:hypothetical protein